MTDNAELIAALSKPCSRDTCGYCYRCADQREEAAAALRAADAELDQAVGAIGTLQEALRAADERIAEQAREIERLTRGATLAVQDMKTEWARAERAASAAEGKA